MKKATNDWFISAESDLLLIKEILGIENLTHLSAFHAQQSVEKSFKAVIEEFDLGFIKTHSLEEMDLLPSGKPSLSEAEEFFRFAQRVIEASKKACSTT